ncbi:MAG: S26 family signal peptidase [Candidatus Daviesbacteria bacterium]|nr:S26 family signal peptidase [Candidatus Daviesbacteria bacterium]
MNWFPFSRFTIYGNSMLPVLKPGQDILILCWFLSFKKGDLVVFKKGNIEMVKRVRQISSDRGIFVLGDNEKESTDSRKFGWIKKSEIIGKVIWY